jgi:hypothetical protein
MLQTLAESLHRKTSLRASAAAVPHTNPAALRAQKAFDHVA